MVVFGHGRGSDRDSAVVLREVIDERINVDFDFVMIVSAASINVDAGVEMTMDVRVHRRRP